MPTKSTSENVNFYVFRDRRYEKVGNPTEITVDTDAISDDDLVKIRDKSALTVTVSIDDETMDKLKRLVEKGIRRKKKYLMWKRGRRYLRRWHK